MSTTHSAVLLEGSLRNASCFLGVYHACRRDITSTTRSVAPLGGLLRDTYRYREVFCAPRRDIKSTTRSVALPEGVRGRLRAPTVSSED